jgi:cell division protease FtsH
MSNFREKVYSEDTAKKIDEEVKALTDTAHKQALELLKTHEVQVRLMTDMLMEFETLDSRDVKEIMDGSWSMEAKRERLKTAEDLQRKAPPAPPPAPKLVKEPKGLEPEMG